MRSKVKATATSAETAVQDRCHHYWILEKANGPTSRGVCKFCGTEKEFDNRPSDTWVEGDISMYFDLPRYPNIELDSEDEDN